MKEFTDIKGYEGLYSINEVGEVWSYKRKQKLAPQDNGKGYKYVRLMKDGKIKNKYLHRLLAETFIPNPENKPCVSHLDENRSHNEVSNLAWATHEENNNMPLLKERLSESLRNNPKISKKVYCVELDRVFPSISEAERELGIATVGISRACRGMQKTAGKFHWEYVEDN